VYVIIRGKLFKSHPFYVETGAENHSLQLMKLIGILFVKVICFSYCKDKNYILIVSLSLFKCVFYINDMCIMLVYSFMCCIIIIIIIIIFLLCLENELVRYLVLLKQTG
jgi:hypothetical protein